MPEIAIYDATLRDGAQGEGINFTVEDKIAIALKLDELGVAYIEGGFPFSNEKDIAFFKQIKKRPLKTARVVAFGSTRRAKSAVDEDAGLAALLSAGTKAVAVVGKSWDLHVRDVLRASLEENTAMIADSVRYLKSKGLEVIFDAEHFFDGYRHNRRYALCALQAARSAGADTVVLCDTNGGSLPSHVLAATAAVVKEIGGRIGFHGHNDSGMAVANSITAVEAGATHVQGTINGLGERTGNADLCQVIPNLQLKLQRRCLADEKLGLLTETSRFVYETANLPLPVSQPFVGRAAFAHKGGMHVDAVRKNPATYEHIGPEQVGNERRLLLSELSGSATVLEKMAIHKLTHDPKIMRQALRQLQSLENVGYQFEAAEASFALLVRRMLGKEKRFFDFEGFRVIVEKRDFSPEAVTEATIKLRVGGVEELCASEGDGPVNALDRALRKALERFYPSLSEMQLTDYKVRVINPSASTAARVRVVIQSRDREAIWGTVGVSENLIEASWQALVDSVVYKLTRDEEKAG
jgi:2-isopropylmalate synthase